MGRRVRQWRTYLDAALIDAYFRGDVEEWGRIFGLIKGSDGIATDAPPGEHTFSSRGDGVSITEKNRIPSESPNRQTDKWSMRLLVMVIIDVKNCGRCEGWQAPAWPDGTQCAPANQTIESRRPGHPQRQ